MSEINDRIAAVVTATGLSKTDFGKAINVTPAYISKLAKKGTPSDSTIADICREFRVNETWLRTGEGEMFKPIPRTDAIATFMTDLLKDEEDSFRRRLIEAMAYWTEEDWEDMARLAKKLALETTQDEKKG
jgi:transcriptional regulator with XRE-family HTH domain